MKRIPFVILLLNIVFPVLAQNSISITGKIIDKETKEPLPYANISYLKKSLGTISNANGDFTLSLSHAHKSDSIIFSYLGYVPYRTIVSKISDHNIIKLVPRMNKVAEVIVKSEKFRLKPFMKEVIGEYNKNRRSTPHIAIAHYREKAKENGAYIMFMESIGYSVYGGKIPNATPLSNYKFFCENTKSFSFHPEWTKFGRDPIGTNKRVMQAGAGKNLNTFRRIELAGLLSEKKFGKYNFKIDSSYFVNNQEILVVHFKGNKDEGQIFINRVNQHILQIKGKTDKIYNRFPLDKNQAVVDIQLNYYNDTPFISRMKTHFTSGALEYQNTLTILLQKYNQFKFTKEEYWSLNSYDHSPYIQYNPQEFDKWEIGLDSNYNDMEKQLLPKGSNLEDYFVENSGYWLISGNKELELARQTINRLIENF